jgi:zinc/manganese transport system permease protein
MSVGPTFSLDLVSDVRELLAFPFMVNALQAASIVAALAAVVGWYMVLRRQSFAGHTLSMMAFPGATGAALAGLPAALGYYVACGIAALAMGATGRSGRRRFATESAAIGTVQATGLALGFLFLSLNSAVLGGMETFLFGNILAVTRGQVLVLLIVALLALSLVAVIARPLLFASVDPEVARARGVPVALLDVGFLLLLGLAVAATSQITGVLLVFTLLVAPPAAAQLITAQPVAGLVLSVAFALAIAWLGLGIAYFSIYPASFFITMFAFGLYVAVRCTRWALARRRVP